MRIFIYFTLILFSQWASGQNIGRVIYKETITLEYPEEMRAMAASLPKETEIKKELTYKGNEANYSTMKEQDEDQALLTEDERRRNRMIKRFSDNNGLTYMNKDENLLLEQAPIFGKDFVIKEDLTQYKWKVLAAEQRDILGYTCMKAEFQDTNMVVTAWFTPQVQASYGPAGYHGLPGLILAITLGDKKVILASSVETDLVAESIALTIPETKDAISRDEFVKIRDEKIAEMRAMWGGGNRRRN